MLIQTSSLLFCLFYSKTTAIMASVIKETQRWVNINTYLVMSYLISKGYVSFKKKSCHQRQLYIRFALAMKQLHSCKMVEMHLDFKIYIHTVNHLCIYLGQFHINEQFCHLHHLFDSIFSLCCVSYLILLCFLFLTTLMLPIYFFLFPISIKEAVTLINTIDLNKFSRLISRILQKLHLKVQNLHRCICAKDKMLLRLLQQC